MKKIYTSILAAFTAAFSFAQVGATAPDFTVTDLDGNSHNLYSYLDAGKVVILDCSTTWCSSCWNFHTAHFLEDLYTTYGPEGTNQIVVIFYEADGSTTLSDLQGTGTNTQGDWLTGSSYPFINESPISLSGSVYWPLGYPTINVISPADKKIKADLWDSFGSNNEASLNAMVDVIDDYWSALSVEEENISSLSIFPNPSNNNFTITINENVSNIVTVNIYNLMGQKVYSEVDLSTNNSKLFIETNLTSGNYIVNVTSDEQEFNKKLVIH